METNMETKEREVIEELIENEDDICFDLCASVGQMFDNIKDMKCFRVWLLEYVKEDYPELLR